jgi:hypothetical protein
MYGQILQFALVFFPGTVSKLEMKRHVAAKKNTRRNGVQATFKFTPSLKHTCRMFLSIKIYIGGRFGAFIFIREIDD